MKNIGILLPTIERITIENYMNIHFNTEEDYFKK